MYFNSTPKAEVDHLKVTNSSKGQASFLMTPSDCRESHSMYIDGQFIAISDEQSQLARQQLNLPTDFHLVEATRILLHDTCNGVVRIPLPNGQVVAAFENQDGRRQYGVVTLNVGG